MNLVSLHGLVLKDFMKALKAAVLEQVNISNSQKSSPPTPSNTPIDPQNADQYHQEEKAILNYWKANKDIWIKKGTTQGKETGEHIAQKTLKREEIQLDKANDQRQRPHPYNKFSHTTRTNNSSPNFPSPNLPRSNPSRPNLSRPNLSRPNNNPRFQNPRPNTWNRGPTTRGGKNLRRHI
jgi:hypothetical protein